MKVYTKTGDTGTTSLLEGHVFPSDIKMEAVVEFARPDS
jgi:cob(I)alamin adenosyltransferase